MNGWEQWSRADPARQRLIFRIVSGHFVRILGRLSRQHNGDLLRAYVWFGLADRADVGGDLASTAVGIRPLSRSLTIPHETVRRKLADLIAEGYCRRLDDGTVGIVADQVTGEAARALASEELESILEAAMKLRASGLELPPLGAPAADIDVDQLTIRLLRAFHLRCYEAGVGLYGSLVDGAIIMGMLQLNASPITENHQLAWRYAGADTPPPDTARVSVTIGQVAGLMHLPRETVRRRVQRFIKLGWVERLPDGYRVSLARLQAPESLANGAIMAQRFMVLLAALRSIGQLANADLSATG